MARRARLDAPNALHHVMARGIDKQPIFCDAADAWGFVRRLESAVTEEGWTIYAWALLTNHFHLLVRTGRRPLGRIMSSLLTGHAVVFNRRHGRVGHLFQNRFRSILCEDESYLLRVLRYIHLNPLRAGLVRDLDELERFPFSGHAALTGRAPCVWQAVESVLEKFGRRHDDAIAAYREYVGLGVAFGSQPELVTGRVLKRGDGWSADVGTTQHGREQNASNERVLAEPRFVLDLERELAMIPRLKGDARMPARELLGRVALSAGVEVESLRGSSRIAGALRAVASHVWIDLLGRSGSELARELGVGRATIYRGARRVRRWKNEGSATGLDALVRPSLSTKCVVQ